MYNDYIDLRELQGTEKRKFKKAIENEGYDFKLLKENEPTLIPESCWKEYAENNFDDIYLACIPREERNQIEIYIDYERWATDLAMDYNTIEVDGIEYYFRCF